MTNRKDMIDEAILRPGRLEIHIEITLPSEPGRLQILNIKTLEMRNAKRTTDEVSTVVVAVFFFECVEMLKLLCCDFCLCEVGWFVDWMRIFSHSANIAAFLFFRIVDMSSK